MMDNIFIRQEKERYNMESHQHLYQYSLVYWLLVLGCIASDGYTLFSLIDMFFNQNIYLSLVITIAVAGVLNIAAVLFAACVENREFSKWKRRGFCALLLGIFLLFFSVTFDLRISSQEMLYSSGDSSIDSISAYEEETEEEFVPTKAQNIMAVMLGLEPLGTSVLCLFIGLELSPNRKLRHKRRLQKLELEDAIDLGNVRLTELVKDMEYDLHAYDRNLYEEMIAQILQLGECAKTAARNMLAKHDGTPEGIAYLMEREYLRDESKAAEGNPAHPETDEKDVKGSADIVRGPLLETAA